MHVFIAALHRPIKPTGVCRHAANLARCLAKQPEVTKISLIIGSWQSDYFQTAFALESEKIELVSVKIKNSSLVRNLWFLQGLPKLANRLNADVIHLSFPFPFLRNKFEAPVVTTVHDLYPYECPENFGFPRVLFNQLFLKQAIASSDGLPCVSQVTLDKLKLYFPQLKSQQQLEVVYNYVDFEGLETYAPKQLTAGKFLLTVAQHRQNKNLDLLIKAYAKLRQTQKIDLDCNLIIVGTTGPETEKLKSLIVEFDLQERVSLLSAINDSELGWLYQNCEVFIIPSSTEGFCLPLAEALHFSDRIVCSDIPIFREIATKKCTYFSLENDALDNLTQALVEVMQRPQALSQQDINRFDRLHIAQQYLDLYSQVS